MPSPISLLGPRISAIVVAAALLAAGSSLAVAYMEISRNITDTQQDMARIAERLDAQANKVGSLETHAASVDGRIDTIEKRVLQADSRLDIFEKRIAATGNDLNTLDTRILDANGRMDALDQRIVGPNSRLSALENQLNSVDARLAILQGKLDKICFKSKPPGGEFIAPC